MDPALIFRAIEFAAAAHSGQFRKGTRIPYIFHPLNAARLLMEAGCPDHLAAAAILHDVVEDTPVELAMIEEEFGEEVAALVDGASEPDKSASWEDRKHHTVEFLKTANEEMLLVAIADKIDNIRSIEEDLVLSGERTWSRFKRGRDKQQWYYESLLSVFQMRLKHDPGARLTSMFAQHVRAVFGHGGARVAHQA